MQWLPNGTARSVRGVSTQAASEGVERLVGLVCDLRDTTEGTVSQSSSSLDTFELGGRSSNRAMRESSTRYGWSSAVRQM